MSPRLSALSLLACLGAAALVALPASAQAPVTSQPIKATLDRGLHKLFPFREEDEAFIAQAHGQLDAKGLQALLYGADEDYFHDMDYGITKDPAALAKTLGPYVPGITGADAVRRVARGRANWIVWSAGNDRFWTYMSQATFGSLDFLKTVSNYDVKTPGPDGRTHELPTTRDTRWKELGLVNEPCFEKGAGPRADRWGLWLEQAVRRLPAGPIREQGQVSRHQDRLARQAVRLQGPADHRRRRLDVRLRQRRDRLAPLPQPRVRAGGGREVGREQVLQRPCVL